jgi:hypothetical protein
MAQLHTNIKFGFTMLMSEEDSVCFIKLILLNKKQ